MTTVLDTRTTAHATPGHADGSSTSDAPVEAVNRQGTRELYAARRKVYPRLAHGTYRRVKWAVMIVTLGIYYALPWLRWPRGADLPDQAVLLDVANNRFFVFFLEIWPQEFYFITGLLILGALTLFLATSIAGRVWCGYACPQTVWTDLMITIERFWQGDRNARIRLDKEPWSAVKLFKKTMTHLSWALVGVLTGGALVFYFRDAPTLAQELLTGTAPAIAYLFLGIFATTTYLLGGIAREQVCTYMCPWPRIQGAMTDRHTMLVSYRAERGEPRGPMRKASDGEVDWSDRGDCIDCKACVAVCPAGIDIRDGSQLECIQCALCIDACDEIMQKIGRPLRLIAYDTMATVEAKQAGAAHVPLQVVRPRTIIYAGLLALVASILLWGWFARALLEVNVLHERNPPYVRLSNGGMRNSYTVKVLNKRHEARTFELTTASLPTASVSIAGAERRFSVATDTLREVRVFVTVERDGAERNAGTTIPIEIKVRDVGSGEIVTRRTSFQFAPRAGG